VKEPDHKITSAHWGTYRVTIENGHPVALHGISSDEDPSPISEGMIDTLSAPSRIGQPMIRKGYLEGGVDSDRAGRGREPFVAVSWDEAEKLVAAELDRVRKQHGNEAIYGGCYGWASAGRFHHAQSQTHRFLKMLGGYTRSVDTYSYAAGQVIMPHVLGNLYALLHGKMTTWPSIVDHTELMVCFGGLPLKNAQISGGGTGSHAQRGYMEAARNNGVDFVNISPIREDTGHFLQARWLACAPNTDVAIMLGLAHTLIVQGLHDGNFLEKYCVGFERFQPYVLGHTDGQPKDADWAAGISELSASDIRELAQSMAQNRTMISVSWSLTRQHHGEQTYWMATVLAAMLGQIGLPGGGIGYGYSAENAIGNHVTPIPWASLPQGHNKVRAFIPVVRIADMLLNPGAAYEYDGQSYEYPDIRLIYWAGGNPFHHHQNLNRLLKAWQKPETIIVHEPWWNALARHADVVLPCTSSLERMDISCSPTDSYAFPMHQIAEPYEQARNDYEIFAGIAARLGFESEFTEERSEEGWLRHLYDSSRQRAEKRGIDLPIFDDFMASEGYKLPESEKQIVMLSDFRRDPDNNALQTPSGRIEIYSENIAGFGYSDCPGHPVWMEPIEWLHSDQAKSFPLHLISNQPKTRLHSQLDHGAWSRGHKVAGREPITLHPDDAAERGISDGDIVRIFNARGACLGGAVLSSEIRSGVVQMATGAWYDPENPHEEGSRCKHGNVNVLTLDIGTSSLAQGCVAHTCLVEVERLVGAVPPLTAHEPPVIIPETERN
jgi:biotin/methionine sulfoxide reductase